MEMLHEAVTDPKDGLDNHLKHLWENNNPKSIFFITGLDVSPMMAGKKDTSGIKIHNPNK